jgi:hypothetical protein
MSETVNTFKSLNQDISKSKYSPDNYFYGLNIQTVTTTGLSTGSIQNTIGNRLEFVIPDIPTFTYEVGSETGSKVIPALTNLEIIGWTSYSNYLIIITCSGIYGQVWRVQYNESTNQLIGLSGNNLVPGNHLIYNRELNFSNTKRIKCFVREESSKFIRLYINDGLGEMKSLNLAGTNAEILETRVRTIEIHAKNNFKLPILQEILNGNLPNCRIGYFYRLISKEGSITSFSPISNLIDLNNGNEAGLYQFYPENPIEFKDENQNIEAQKRLDFSSEKACKILIDNIDKDYDYIQVGFVQYTIKDSPEIFLFPEEPLNIVNGIKRHLFIHSGLEEVFSLSAKDFLAISNTFEVFEDFVPKHNELYVANITNSQYDVDFDARTYRFKANQDCNIYDETGVLEKFIDGAAPVYPNTTTELEFDAINPFNDENPTTNPNWLTDDQYKFQADGTTLGGEGPNIKYKFTTNLHLVDTIENPLSVSFLQKTVTITDTDNIAPFNTVKLESASTASFGISGQTYTINKSYSDLKSPYKSSIYESYARGEVMRFGLVFVNTKGQKSFVKWIGDIKFPFFHDAGYEIGSIVTTSNFEYYVKTLGIEFQISNLSAEILEDLSHIEIVRVERTEDDRSKLGTGVTGGFVNYNQVPFTLADFTSFISGIIQVLLKKVVGKAGSFFTWATDSIFEQIGDNIANAITNGFSAAADSQLWENINESDLKNLLTNSIGQLGGKSGTGIVGLMTNRFGEQLGAWIIERLGDDLKNKKIAGIAKNVYSLDNVQYNTPSTTANIDEIGSITGKNMGYIISPITQFDKYKYRNGDYLVPLASYEYQNGETYKTPKITNVYHRDTNVGVFNRTHSTAKFKKWYNPVYFNDTIDPTNVFRAKLPIDLENILDVGELLLPDQISGIDGVISNSYIGYIERLDDAGEYIIPSLTTFSVREKVLGIGDKKHFIKTSSNFPGLVDTTDGGYIVYDNQGDGTDNRDTNDKWFGLRYSDSTYDGTFPSTPITTDLTLTRPNAVDTSGNFLISYERYISEQYGGNSFTARSLNKYINVATIPVNNIPEDYFTCYKGDSYVGLYDSVNYAYYLEQIPGYDPASMTKKACGELFPAEAPFNFNVREGEHFNNAANADDLDVTEKRVKRALKRARRKSKKNALDYNEIARIITPKRFLYDSHIYNDIYDQHNSIQLAFPRPLIDIFVDTNTNRIYKSNSKIDGELVDSWKLFKANNFIDVEGVYGPITSIHNHRDRLYFYQKNAFGIVTTNERAAATTNTGSLSIADSVSLSRYDYMSLETGCSHKFGVVNTDGALFHFDINNKKLFQFSQGLTPLSDIKGLSAYFKNNLQNGTINTLDQTIATNPAGLHGIYDNNSNRVYFTFLNQIGETRNDFTINYNLLSQEIESFHSFTPGIYLKTPKKLYSVNSDNKKQGYLHGFGNYNTFYGTLFPSIVTIIVNDKPQNIKTFDNHLIFTEVTDSNGINLVNETISQIKCTNDYQDSGTINLVVNNNIRRIDRKWHLQIPRDINPAAYTSLKSRLSDTHLFSTLTYNNPNNRKLILHDIYTFYRESIT